MYSPCPAPWRPAASCANAALLLAVATWVAPCAAEGEELLAAPKLLMSPTPLVPAGPVLPPMPTLPPVYNCVIGDSADWPEAQQTWCCTNFRLGCETTTEEKTTSEQTTTAVKHTTTLKPTTTIKETTAVTHTTTLKPTTTIKETTAVKRTTTLMPKTTIKETTTVKRTTTLKPSTTSAEWTTLRSTSTSVPTTTVPTTTTIETTNTITCDSSCTINGVAATCRDQIQQSALSDFLGRVDSCLLAQEVTAYECPVCGGCPPVEAGCGVLELETTTAPTTTFPQGNPCSAVCTLGGQPATCKARITWSHDHVFLGKPQPCQQAHAMVMDQCSVCSECTLKKACQEQAASLGSAEELFDCDSGATVEWSDAKASWCCEHHERGCDVLPQDKQRIFFQKKVSAAEGANDELDFHGRTLAVVFFGLGALGSAILLFARSSSMGRQFRRRDCHNDGRSLLAE